MKLKWLYQKALHAMSERYWGDSPPYRGPLWASLVWDTRNYIPRSWWDY